VTDRLGVVSSTAMAFDESASVNLFQRWGGGVGLGYVI
jgi:hypothetical protein